MVSFLKGAENRMDPNSAQKTWLRTQTLNRPSLRSQFHCLPACDPVQVTAKSRFFFSYVNKMKIIVPTKTAGKIRQLADVKSLSTSAAGVSTSFLSLTT